MMFALFYFNFLKKQFYCSVVTSERSGFACRSELQANLAAFALLYKFRLAAVPVFRLQVPLVWLFGKAWGNVMRESDHQTRRALRFLVFRGVENFHAALTLSVEQNRTYHETCRQRMFSTDDALVLCFHVLSCVVHCSVHYLV